jgi:predicted RND superfamily exporter protein
MTGAVGWSLYMLPQVDLNFSIGPLLESSKERRQEVRDFNKMLPPIQAQMAALVEFSEPIGADELAALADYGERLNALETVRLVRSLATVKVIEADGLVPKPTLIADLAADEKMSSIVNRHPLLDRRLISGDRKSVAVMIHTKTSQKAVDALQAVTPPAGATSMRIIGPPLVEKSMRRMMQHDMMRSLALEGVLFLVLLMLYFRSVRDTLVPILVIGSAVALHFGLTKAMGWQISIIETAIPGLIVIISLCDTVHMIDRFREATVRGEQRRDAVFEMMETVGAACLYTSLTTALGFLSLLLAPHNAVRDFAVTASIGVVIAFLCVTTLLPVLLDIWPAKEGAVRLHRMPKPPRLTGRSTVALFTVLIAISLVGAYKVDVDSHWLEELPASDPVVANMTWYEQHFGGLLSLEVKVDGPLDDPAAFRSCEAMQQRLLSEPDVTIVDSYTLWLREAASNQGELSDEQITAGVAVLKLAGPVFPKHVVSQDFRHGRLHFSMGDVGTKRYLELRDMVHEEAKAFPSSVNATVSGYARMAHESGRLVVTTMIRSFAVTLLVIVVFISIIYRSWRLGLIASIPNALPIVFALGVTGWLDIHLRIGIVMIYSVGIGLAVDDCIHLLTRFHQERLGRPEATTRSHLDEALRTTGSTLVLTSLILTLGALCYLPSSFQSMQDVGTLLSVIVVSALAVDVILLPVLIERFLENPNAEVQNSKQSESSKSE